MLIFGEDTDEKNCKFNVTKKTKNYLIAFFGFFPHSIHDRYISFLEYLDIKEVAGKSDICSSLFNLNSQYALEAYNCCDRRTFDVTIILPYSFKTKKEAIDWFKNKIATSKKLSEKDFCEIKVIDGDKLIKYVRDIESYKQKEDFIEDIIKFNLSKCIRQLKSELLNDYTDKDYQKLIELQMEEYYQKFK